MDLTSARTPAVWLFVISLNVVFTACILVSYSMPTTAPKFRVHFGRLGGLVVMFCTLYVADNRRDVGLDADDDECAASDPASEAHQQQLAATPRPRRGSSFDESRRRRGYDADGPRRPSEYPRGAPRRGRDPPSPTASSTGTTRTSNATRVPKATPFTGGVDHVDACRRGPTQVTEALLLTLVLALAAILRAAARKIRVFRRRDPLRTRRLAHLSIDFRTMEDVYGDDESADAAACLHRIESALDASKAGSHHHDEYCVDSFARAGAAAASKCRHGRDRARATPAESRRRRGGANTRRSPLPVARVAADAAVLLGADAVPHVHAAGAPR